MKLFPLTQFCKKQIQVQHMTRGQNEKKVIL